MTPAEYAKKRRDAARAAGLCGQCCKRKALEGRYRCQVCLDGAAVKAQHALGNADTGHHCTHCHQLGHDRRTCPDATTMRGTRPVVEWCDDCITGGGRHRADCPTRRAA